jgi:hypothetical protein
VLDAYTAEEVDAAITEALTRGTPHVGAVRQALDRARATRGEPPPLGLHLPDSPKLEGLVVRPHALSTYDQLTKDTSNMESSDDDR